MLRFHKHALTAKQWSKWLPRRVIDLCRKWLCFWGHDDSQGKAVSSIGLPKRVTLTLFGSPMLKIAFPWVSSWPQKQSHFRHRSATLLGSHFDPCLAVSVPKSFLIDQNMVAIFQKLFVERILTFSWSVKWLDDKKRWPGKKCNKNPYKVIHWQSKTFFSLTKILNNSQKTC